MMTEETSKRLIYNSNAIWGRKEDLAKIKKTPAQRAESFPANNF